MRHAPGHTQGSTVFTTPGDAELPPLLFSGDLLFAGSIGRTDLPGGDSTAMMRSLRTVLTDLADETVVLPGHGEQTTMAEERRSNPSSPARRRCERRLPGRKGVAEYTGADARAFAAVRDALGLPGAPATASWNCRSSRTLRCSCAASGEHGRGEEGDVHLRRPCRTQPHAAPGRHGGAIRAIIEGGLDRGQLPVKTFYAGPFFRAERPEAGRFRQFTQVGVEAVGSDDPALDAEVIAVADDGYRDLGLRDYTLLLNSLGCRECRPRYTQVLSHYLAGFDLDPATAERARINPLRVLDDKRPELAELVAMAPLPVDYLCEECREHYDDVRRYLRVVGWPGRRRRDWCAV